VPAKNTQPEIDGFLAKPKKTAQGNTYRGRFTCHDVQWTGEVDDIFATFTATAEEIADAAESRLVWTDQDVQRGILPGLLTRPPRELSLADGYPDAKIYIFDTANADDMTEKLLAGERLFLSPLVWNLRPGQFEAYADTAKREIYIYSGKVYLPDSHHRQQAILKAVRLWKDAPEAYPKFSGSRQFKVELYFLTKQDEGNYFFDKNQRPKPTAQSKAYDLTTHDDLSLLAKSVIKKSHALTDNVNRVTDRLSAKNFQVRTLSTLREMMKTFAPSESLDAAEMEGLAVVAATFYDALAVVRPELGKLTVPERRAVREKLLVDSAVMMHGYAALMRDFNSSIAEGGVRKATVEWEKSLAKLSSQHTYSFGRWSGDIFEKINPLWLRVGVVKRGRDRRKLTVLNTGAARGECARVLRSLLSLSPRQKELRPLSRR
jgi:DNA-sulfur modification-associated